MPCPQRCAVVARGSAATPNLVAVDRTGKARSLLNEQRSFGGRDIRRMESG
jgi:hypothetical protein